MIGRDAKNFTFGVSAMGDFWESRGTGTGVMDMFRSHPTSVVLIPPAYIQSFELEENSHASLWNCTLQLATRLIAMRHSQVHARDHAQTV